MSSAKGNHSCRVNHLLAGAVFAALSIAASRPAAAATDTDAAGASSSEGAGSLGEIVVTAQKRAERQEDVPVSISIVSGDALFQRGVDDVASLPQSVPALRITYAGTFVQPTIRGIGSQVALPGLPQNIPTYVDGYYVPDPAADNFNLVNTESVSVLKGPQGTLFGYNSTGGAIQITTRDPQQETSGLVRAGYASFNHLSTAFYGTTGLTDTLAVDTAAAFDRSDGYDKNIYTGDKNFGEYSDWYVRSKVKWTPVDGVSFLLAYYHNFNDNPFTQDVVARNRETVSIATPGALIPAGPREVAISTPSYSRLISDSYTLTSKFNLGFADLTSYTGYRTDTEDQALDYDASAPAVNGSAWTVPDKTTTQELDLTSKSGGRFNWVLGGFYMHAVDSYDYRTNGNPVFTSKNSTDSWAAFADGTYQVLDDLYFTAGTRYTTDHPWVAFDLIPLSFAEKGGVNFDNVSSRGVLRYKLTPDSNVYGSFTQGYKAGGLPASDFSLVPVKPEKINAYEVGYKVAQNAIRFNAAAFYYDYKDVQVTTYQFFGSTVANAASVHIYGLDADLTLQVTPDFDFTLSGAYAHARYENFPDASAWSQNLNPASPAYGVISQVGYDATGLPVERAPSFSGSLSANYGLDVASGRLVLNGNLFYTTKYYFDVAEQAPQNAYAVLNLRATWTDPTKHYDVSVFGTNVTNTKYYISSFIDPSAFRSVYGQPAMFGGNVTFHF